MTLSDPERQGSAVERVPVGAIVAFMRDAFVAIDVPLENAQRVAELVVQADLAGADAHGLFRLPQYVRRTRGGAVNPRANIVVERTAPATAMVDGDNGLGHLVMGRATDT